MLKVYIIRHGETDWNNDGRLQGWTDTPLNERGQAQARLIAERLRGEPDLAALYSSPLQRAWETAERIGESSGLTPVSEPRLKERCLGVIEGLTFAEVEARYPDEYRRWRSENRPGAFPGEEAREAFQRRIQELFRDLEARHTAGRIVLVTHGGALGMMIATLLRLDLDRHFPFWFDNACLNLVELGGRVPRVLSLNDTCHLRNGAHHASPEQELALQTHAGDRAQEASDHV